MFDRAHDNRPAIVFVDEIDSVAGRRGTGWTFEPLVNELLRQIDAQANLADGRSYALNGMLVVDEQRLTQLPDVDVVRLYRSGMMATIHAHLVSLRNLGVLIDRKAARL